MLYISFYFFILTDQKIFIANNEFIGVTDRAIKCDNIFFSSFKMCCVCVIATVTAMTSTVATAADDDDDDDDAAFSSLALSSSSLPDCPWI